MDLFRRTARGRLSALVGSVEVAQDTQFLTLFITRDLKRIEDVLVQNLDAATSAKIAAFSSGVNAYIAFMKLNPTLMPQEYAQLPGPPTPNDIPDWAPADTLATGRLQQFQLSETIEKETNYGLIALTFGPTGTMGRSGNFGGRGPGGAGPLSGLGLTPSLRPMTRCLVRNVPTGGPRQETGPRGAGP